MSITALFYVFTKKPNSTMQPSDGISAQIQLKEETDILNPEITVYGIPNPYVWNYCYIATFSRYYWISSWQWLNGRWGCRLRVDVLASYKNYIGSSSQYVARSAAAYDGKIADTLYPKMSQYALDSVLLGSNQRQIIGSGYFMLGVIAPSGGVLGSAVYYLLNWQALIALKTKLLSNLQWTSVTEVTDELLQTLFNPFQYILSCKWFPNSPPASALTQVTQINFGYWTFDLSSVQGTSAWLWASNAIPTVNVLRYSVSGPSIPQHPQSGSRGIYLSGEAYSEYYLMISGYGRQRLPNWVVQWGYGLTIMETQDFVSGDSILNVYAGAGADQTATPVITVKSHIGIDVPFAQVDQNVLQGAVDAVNGVADTGRSLMSFEFGGAIQNAVTGVANVAKDLAPVVQSGGSPGSWAALGEYGGSDGIECVFTLIGNEDNADLGRPLCQVRQLSTLPGYQMIVKPHVAIPGSDGEAAEIERYLAEGYYYE